MAEPTPFTYKNERNIAQEFLANRAFQRLFGSLETYQNLWREAATDDRQRAEMKLRMHDLFGHQDEATAEVNQMRLEILDWCENDQLSAERLAERFARFSMADQLLSSIDSQAGMVDEHGGVMLNEVAKYNINKDVLSLTLAHSNYSGEEVWTKYAQGLRLLAEKLKAGEFPEVKIILRISWLYASGFKKRMEQINGEGFDAALEDTSEEDARESQYTALTSNKRTLQEYLTTGKLPEVKTLRVSREEFVARFTK